MCCSLSRPSTVGDTTGNYVRVGGREGVSDSSSPVRSPTRRRLLSGGGAVGLALLGGCAAPTDSEPTPTEATVTVRLRNRDDVSRSYEVVVRQGGDVTNQFTGVLPADTEQAVEMVAYVRPTTAQHEVAISTDAGQRGRTWDPTECSAFVVDAYVEDGEPGFDASCASDE